MTEYPQVKPSVFAGSACWHTLYTFVSAYEPTELNKELYKAWIELTLKLFPCDICSKHALETYRRHNIDNYLQNKDRLYLYISAILHDGANDFKGIPIEDRPNYYESKKFIFQSMTGACKKCGH